MISKIKYQNIPGATRKTARQEKTKLFCRFDFGLTHWPIFFFFPFCYPNPTAHSFIVRRCGWKWKNLSPRFYFIFFLKKIIEKTNRIYTYTTNTPWKHSAHNLLSFLAIESDQSFFFVVFTCRVCFIFFWRKKIIFLVVSLWFLVCVCVGKSSEEREWWNNQIVDISKPTCFDKGEIKLTKTTKIQEGNVDTFLVQ